MDSQTIKCVALYLRYRRKQKVKRKFWVNPVITQRLLKGQFHILFESLQDHPDKFFNYYGMSLNSFNELLAVLHTQLSFKDTNMRKCVSPEERLSVTLRYLATGHSFVSLHYQYMLGASTIRKIVWETCHAIWVGLKTMCIPTLCEEKLLEISNKFYERTNFPNSIGAVEGKHIRIVMPPNSRSDYFSYKGYASVVLLAVADADYCFSFVDVGACQKFGDANIFQNSTLGKKLQEIKLNIPEQRKLPFDESGEPMPYVFVGDETFAVSSYVLRPYPNRYLTAEKRIFNYRLCRARRMVECTFGIFASKWRIFQRSLDVNVDFAVDIIRSACVLHNFVRKRDGYKFEDSLYQESSLDKLPVQGIRGTTEGIQARDYFATYFTSPQGSISGQYDKI